MSRNQLRIYDIEPGRLREFVDAWLAGVAPLRARHGFNVEAWTVPTEDRFIWVLTYGGPLTFEEADEAYYGSPEREHLRPDPAAWIVGQQTIWLDPVAIDRVRGT